ncbi:MAG: hypothetical protein ACMXYK_04185 [Candidatus Woesearchaeota archaeon]
MNVKKVVRKIAAVATGTALLGATILGASAANLNNYPEPFVADGVANVQFVIGSGSTDDYLGALDIATNLQASAVSSSTVNVPGAASTVEVEGGYALSTRSTPLVLGTAFTEARNQLRDTQLPDLLEDGRVRIGNVNYDTTQFLRMSNRNVSFQQLNNVPTLMVDLSEANNRQLWNYTLTIDPINVTNLGRSEAIYMLNKRFTFAPDMTQTGNVVLFASEVTTNLVLNEPVTVESNGQSYTIEIVGANSDDNSIILSVNGRQRTLGIGNNNIRTDTIDGLEVFIEDLFITNIPTLSASANVFVGSQRVELRNGALADVEINNERVAGLRGNVTRNAGGELSEINIVYSPYNLRNDVSGFDRVEELLPGDSISDPLFGTFEIRFEGMNFDLRDSAKAHVALEAGRDDFTLVFEDYYGDKVEFVPFTAIRDTTNIDYTFYVEGEGFGVWAVSEEITEDAIFALEESFGQTETGTKLYEVVRIRHDGTTSGTYVELRDLGTGSVRSFRENDRVGDSEAFIDDIDSDEESFTLSGAGTVKTLFLKGGIASITLDNTTLDEAIVIEDDSNYVKTLDLRYDATNDATIRVNNTGTTADAIRHRDNDEDWYLTSLGTFAIVDVDDRDRFDAWVVTEEDNKVIFNVFVAPTGASVTSTGAAGGSVTTQTVNPLSVGVAVRDTDVNLANPASNLIVVGGSCINTVAAQLMGVPAGTCGTDSGLNPGEAVIELFELDNGRVAMLVAGWEAPQTVAASRAVVSENLSGSRVTLTATSANNYEIQ